MNLKQDLRRWNDQRSASGIVPKINKLSRDIDVSLAISLHAPDDKLRDEIVPINKKYPIKQLIKACKDYLSHFESKKILLWNI